jgi:hypothetical protein
MSGLSAECKADLILANEGRLRKTNELYQAFNEKKTYLVIFFNKIFYFSIFNDIL